MPQILHYLKILPYLTLAVACVWAAPLAAAAPETRELYEQGARAYREAHYERAIELFQRAQKLEPYPELAFDLGRAYEAKGELGRAIESFREYLRLAPDANDRATVEARIVNLTRRFEELKPRVTISSSPDQASVTIDDQIVGTTPWSGVLPAGTHRVRVEHSGHRSAAHQLAVTEGAQAQLHLDLQPTTTEAHAQQSSGVKPRKVTLPTFITLGVGAGALGTALGFELARRSAEGRAEDASTQLAHQLHYRDAEQNRDLARVFASIGGAVTLAGGVLLYLNLSPKRTPGLEREAQAGARSLAVGVLASGAPGVVGSGRF